MLPSQRECPLFERLGNAFGHAIAGYGRWVVRSGDTTLDGHLPPGGCVAVSWHGTIMVSLAVHAELRPGRYHAFVRRGISGAAMTAWLESNHMQPVLLTQETEGNPADGFRQMARVLKQGETIGIAVDGPRGPSRILRPGALWLARLSGRPLVPVGCAAQPAVRLPRWDGHLVPLPGARIATVYGPPIPVQRDAEIDEELRTRVARAIGAAERRAWEIVGSTVPAYVVDEGA